VTVASKREKLLLVGDNPFHGISHLSQERARGRDGLADNPGLAADLLATSLENGADGFMFSVSATTLSILREVRQKGAIERLRLYAIVPYAYEYVRLVTQLGGIPGLAKRFGKEVALSGNFEAIFYGLKGSLVSDPSSLMKAYLSYEISRVRDSAGKKARLDSVMLHQVITDMALGLNLRWMFESYVDYMAMHGITPGFNTGNFAFLVDRFSEWGIDLSRIAVAAPFNKVGFQMIPSVGDCEKALERLPEPVVVAISILAAGYLKPAEAADYIAGLPNISGVAVGVSNGKHARETFKLLKERFGQGFCQSHLLQDDSL